MSFSVLGFSVPVFVLAYILILTFSVQLDWLPVQGYRNFRDGVWEWLRHLILPSIALGTVYVALITRMTRASMLDVLAQDYIRTAEAKGLAPEQVLIGHALKNAAIPVVTIIGVGVALLISGAIVTETVFALPGIGRLTVDAILRRDYPIIQGVILIFPRSTCWSIWRSISRTCCSIRGYVIDMSSTTLACRRPIARSHRYRRRGGAFATRSGVIRRRSSAACILIVMVAIAILAPWLGTIDPQAVSPAKRLKPPSADFWFGTDMLGRDVYSRVVYGARVSLIVGLAVAALSTLLGLAIGLVTGYVRRLDAVVMRVMDGLMSIPSVLLAIALMALHQGEHRQRDRRHHAGGGPAGRAPGPQPRAQLARATVRRSRRSPPARPCRASSCATSCPTSSRRCSCREPMSADRR